MLKLLIIADDSTGALDSSIQFASRGAPVRAYLHPPNEWDGAAEVLVINTDSRHLPAEKAWELVHREVEHGRREGARILFKKIDSALRGNLGSELAAMLSSDGGEQLYLMPAYPAGGRTTYNGVQLWNGVPVAETVYGQDPFEPARHSRVAGAVALQTALPIAEIPAGRPMPRKGTGIVVLDASSDGELRDRCRELLDNPAPLLLGGCAGAASALAECLYPEEPCSPSLPPAEKLLVVSGSLHTVSRGQMAEGRAEGIPCHTLRIDFELARGFAESEAGLRLAQETAAELERHRVVLLETEQFSFSPGCEAGRRTAEAVDRICREAGPVALAVFGGDTLLEIAGLLRPGIRPCWEVVPGVPVSIAENREGNPIPLISKSGGFGPKDVISRIASFLNINFRTQK